MNNRTKDSILDSKIIVICRNVYGDDLLSLANAIFESGINLIEVTFDQKDKQCIAKTTAAIEMLNQKFASTMIVGAGTVLNCEQVEAAYNAGAKYIVSPNVNKQVIASTKEHGLVSIPGAMTASEILEAYDLGADIVKIFPAGHLGTGYIKDIRGPISHVPLLAAGGMRENNIKEFFEAGYDSFAVSGRLTDKALIETKNYSEITNRGKIFRDQLFKE